MCTLSVIAMPWGGYRLVHTRDEQRSRAPEHPPAWRDTPRGRVLCPTDPDAGGTWIALSEPGACTGVLNMNIPDNGREDPARSRGEVPLLLMDADTPRGRLARLGLADLSVYAPFTAFAVESVDARVRVTLAEWDGMDLVLIRDPEDPFEPLCVASSGLGDDRVRCRLPLFDEMVRRDPTPENQDAFHAHRWDESPERSVLMSREDARSTSITRVEVVPGGDPRMDFTALAAGDEAHDPVGAMLLHSRS